MGKVGVSSDGEEVNRAAWLFGVNDLRIQPFKLQPLGRNDVKIRMKAVAICGSDVHYLKHVAEIPYENQHVVNTREVSHGTVTYLEKIKFLEGNLLAAHSVWVSDSVVTLFCPILLTTKPWLTARYSLELDQSRAYSWRYDS